MQKFLARLLAVAVVVAVMAACTSATGGGGTPTSAGFSLETVLSGLTTPTNLEFAPDGRVFVAEKRGTVQTFDSIADPSPTLVIDLSTHVHNVFDFGMLGLAVDPAYPVRPYVYVFYNLDPTYHSLIPCTMPPNSVGCPIDGRVSRITVGPNGTAVGAEKILVEDRFCWIVGHAVADLTFLPDGTLAASAGDGADYSGVDYGQQTAHNPPNPCSDPPGSIGTPLTAPSAEGGALRAQDLLSSGDPVTFDGAVIRIDPDTGSAAAGNPLIGNGVPDDDPVIAFGLRNPYRMAVRPGTGELWVGDVGWNSVEEIDRIPNPTDSTVENFGWPCFEGTTVQPLYSSIGLNLCTGLIGGTLGNGVTPPHATYAHGGAPDQTHCASSTGASVAGMAFYQGGSYPNRFNGALMFADYTLGCIWAMLPGTNGVPDPGKIETVVSGPHVDDIAIGPNGDLYLIDLWSNSIVKVRYSGVNQAPVARIGLNRDNGPVPLSVSLNGSTSSDPEGGGLIFAWDLNGDGAFDDSTSPSPTALFPVVGDVTVRLRVTDSGGASNVASVVVHAGNTRPSPVIVAPPGQWTVGDQLTVNASAVDAEDGPLPAANFSWEAFLEHCDQSNACHQHPLTSVTGNNQLALSAPNHEYPAHLLVRVTATDSAGLTGTSEVRLDPASFPVTLSSQPVGAPMVVGAQAVTAPQTVTVIAGSAFTVAAAASFVVGGVTYVFDHWDDDVARVRNMTFNAPISLHAVYVPA